MLKSFARLFLILCFALPVSATTVYVDFSSGADTNAGTKLSPFKNAPGMNGCASACLSAQTALTAGSQIILKGNVIWPNGSLGLLISASGTAPSHIYYGVDVTWFNNMTGTANTSGTAVTWITGVHGPGVGCNVNCNLFGDFTASLIGTAITVNGGTCTVATVTDATHLTCTTSQGTNTGVAFTIPVWGRPIFDAQNTAMGSHAGLANVMVRPFGNHITIDSIEMRGLFWTGTPGPGEVSYIEFAGGSPGQGVDVEVKNIFVHGWSHGVRASPTCTSEANLILGDSGVPNNNVGSSLHDSIVTGQDTDYSAGTSGAATFGGPPIQYRNLYERVSDGGVIDGITTVHDVTATFIGPTFQVNDAGCGALPNVAHTNAFELNGQSTDATLYNLVIAHLGSGTLALWCGANSGVNCYAFNDVIFDTDTGNILDPAQSTFNNGCPHGPSYCNVAGNFFYYNNTVECGPDAGPPSANCQGSNSAITAITHQNGFYISTGGIFTAPPTPTMVTNLGSGNTTIPLSTACGTNSYCANQAFAFSPTSASGITVGHGTSNSSFCATINTLDSVAGAACLQDTTYGVTVDRTAWTVTGFARTPLTRSTANPSIGAFEFASGGSTPAAQPTFSPIAGTYTSTQNVTPSTTSPGAFICVTTNGTTPVTDGVSNCTVGTKFTTAISVAVTTTVNAVAGGPGYTDSSVGTALYTINRTGGTQIGPGVSVGPGVQITLLESSTPKPPAAGLLAYSIVGIAEVANKGSIAPPSRAVFCKVGQQYTSRTVREVSR